MQNLLIPMAFMLACTVIGAGFAVVFVRLFKHSHEQESAAESMTTSLPPAAYRSPVAGGFSPARPAFGPRHEADPLGMRLNILAVQLRTHITSTRWFSEMLLFREYGKLNFAQMELLHQINDASKKACDVLTQILDTLNVKTVPGEIPGSAPLMPPAGLSPMQQVPASPALSPIPTLPPQPL